VIHAAICPGCTGVGKRSVREPMLNVGGALRWRERLDPCERCSGTGRVDTFYERVCKRLVEARYVISGAGADFDATDMERSNARVLENYVLNLLRDPPVTSEALPVIRDDEAERKVFFDMMMRDAQAPSFCSPPWTRNYSEGVAVAVLLRRENDEPLDLYGLHRAFRDEHGSPKKSYGRATSGQRGKSPS